MARTMAIVAAALALAPAGLHAPSAADSAAVAQAAHDYIDGWWTGDADRMARAVHPELVKRIMTVDSSGTPHVQGMTADQLIAGTRRGGGTRTPASMRRSDVRVLDIFGNTALARIDAGVWVDYLQLVKWQGRWVILNVLWELRSDR